MSITSEANTMRATFPPQSAQVSASREPTPKPSDRVVFSLAHSTTHPHVAGFSSPDWTSSDQHIYDTPSPISIARSSSEGSGQKHLPRSDVHSTDPARRAPRASHDINPPDVSAKETLLSHHDRTIISSSTSPTSTSTPTSSSSDDSLHRLKPQDPGVIKPGDAIPSLLDSTSSDSTTSSSLMDQRDMQDSRLPPTGSSSDSGRPPPSGNRGRPHSQTNRRNQQPHHRSQPFVTPGSHFPGPPSHPPEQASTASAPPPFHSPHAPHPYAPSSAPPYLAVGTPAPGGSFMGSAGSYTISPPPPVNMVPQSRSTFAYPHHPSLHAHDTSMHPQNPSLMGYSTNTLVPIMQPPYSTYTPVPPPPPHGHSPAGSSSSSHLNTPVTSAGAPPSQQNTGSSYVSPHPSAGGYASHRFPTSPYNPYPPHTYGHTGSVYPATYPAFTPASYAPAPLEGQESQGTWWYMPHVSRPPTTSGYDGYAGHTAYAYPASPIGMTELEAAAIAAQGYPTVSSAGSSLYAMSSGSPQPSQSPLQRPLRSPLPPSLSPLHLHSPSGHPQPSPSIVSSSYPSPSAKSDHAGSNPGRASQGSAGAAVPPSGGNPERGLGRRSYHPNPPAHRSEWVMWAGNVPSDATYDELWRFFNQLPSPSAESMASSAGTVASGGSSSSMPTSVKSNPNPPLHGSGYGREHGRGSYSGGPGTSSSSSGAASGPPALQTQSFGQGTSQSSQQPEAPIYGGVESIFLILRSNCAFINFATEEHLHAAIQHFNGRPLRPHDVRCPQLVCRIRGKDDDLKAGVGAQRGAGIHIKWIKDQKERHRLARSMSVTQGNTSPVASGVGRGRGNVGEQTSISSSSEALTSPSSSPGEHPSIASLSDDELASVQRRHGRGRPALHSNSSGSLSTSSSILQQYFPKRYFILKSLTQSDLDLSIQKGLWATQKHNEGILDQAYRTSKDVYLIFSVNKSGEFYGYARMAGPILRGEHQVSWASRSDSPSTRRGSSLSQPSPGPDSPTAARSPPTFFSPNENRLYDESPLPLPVPPDTPVQDRSTVPLSAPAEMGRPYRRLSKHSSAVPTASLDVRKLKPALLRRDDSFELDPGAPMKAAIERSSPDDAPLPGQRSGGPLRDDDGVKRWDMVGLGGSLLVPVEEGDESSQEPPTEEAESKGKGRAVEAGQQEIPRDEGPVWGESFRIEWIRTDRLPFHRTRHLRNPWNHDREVKVSRDGTELEPTVGQALLDEWDKPDPDPGLTPSAVERPVGTKTVPDSVGSPSVQAHGVGRGRGR
ncbi:unnamed protein product [Somion occarium]|uniref:YTH domain-containing protein n=2 Tax=Somion occarium TaxID=3059160 RepID=A0ABP1DZ09_9APHY